jgi:hypothetical protein
LTRWRRILSTCGGSVMMASTLMGWPQREQVRGLPLSASRPAAAQGIHFVDLLDQPSPGGAALCGRY